MKGYVKLEFFNQRPGVLPIMVHTGRPRPKEVRFFRLQVNERVGISQAEVHERVILMSLQLKYFEQIHLMVVSFHLLGTP